MKHFGIVVCVALFLAACGESKPPAGTAGKAPDATTAKTAAAQWSKADKDVFTKGCISSMQNTYKDKTTAFCDCYQAKFEKESPDAKNQMSVSSKRDMEMSSECRPK